jgi:hypothetical protein
MMSRLVSVRIVGSESRMNSQVTFKIDRVVVDHPRSQIWVPQILTLGV